VQEGREHAAWLTLVKHNPMPAVLGRICHRSCESGCLRGEYDGRVAVNALEHYVGDLAIEHGWELPSPSPDPGPGVAVIGGGPSGLAFAYHARRNGLRVAVYDANPELGGVLRYGIPEFRLPTGVVHAEIRRIVDLGIEVFTGTAIDGADDLLELERRYAAVFLAPGAAYPRWVSPFPRNHHRVVHALPFLNGIRAGEPMAVGRRVVVIGGGRVAMDVAGSVLRLGGRPTIVALERRDVMPAQDQSIQEVVEEGALLVDGAVVTDVDAGSGPVTLHCVRVDLDPGAPAGVIRPVARAGTNFALAADTVILAVGQDPEPAGWAPLLRISDGTIEIDGGFRTSRPGVFAAGDATGAERFVATAVGEGWRAADSVARYLERQRSIDRTTAVDAPGAREVAFADINTFYFPPIGREERRRIDAGARVADVREIRLGFTAEQARVEAERCFSCGLCVECDNCLIYCPDLAVARDPSSDVHYRVLDQYCKGCGCCVEECPRGAVGLEEEA